MTKIKLSCAALLAVVATTGVVATAAPSSSTVISANEMHCC